MPDIYWRKKSEELWHKLSAAHPITHSSNIESSGATFEGGQCVALYTITVSYAHNFAQGNASEQSVQGPIQDIGLEEIPSTENASVFFRLYYIDANGNNGTLYGTTLYPAVHFFNWGLAGVTRQGGEDNCGNKPGNSTCTTSFYSNGSLIKEVTDSTCVAVSEAPNECECCGELLGKASSILARLS